MKTLTMLPAFMLLTFVSLAGAVDGLIVIESPYSAEETMNRFEDVVKARGLNVFARINHTAGAAKIGKTLRPTEVIIFGNPQGGTPFMECEQTVGIDLPLKALVWQDESDQAWLAYNDPAFIAERHGVADCPVVGKLSNALAGIAESAVSE